MNRDSHRLTNLLLLAVFVLLIANLAIPLVRHEPPALLPAPAAAPDRHDREIADLVARVDFLLRSVQAPTPSAGGPCGEDEVVVRISGKLARDLGITAEDVRTVVEGFARLARSARPATDPGKSANETSAIATARNCCSAQAQFQATAKADVDRDGTGEFGTFLELSGAADLRGDPQAGRLNPPVLSGAFRRLTPEGFVLRSGYLFAMYLPDGGGDGVLPDTVGYERVDPDQAETRWCMYAWPEEYGVTGRRTFMVNQTGDVVSTDSSAYSGTNSPAPGAAFFRAGRYSVTGLTAVGTTGQDGNLWRQVN